MGRACALVAVLLCAVAARASLFADVSGVVHDPQHRPIAGAQVDLKAATSAYVQHEKTGADGSFRFAALPFGRYLLTVRHAGFGVVTEDVTIASDTSPVLHVMLPLASVEESVTVHGETRGVDASTVTPTVMLSSNEVAQTPGAARANSLAMVTDYVPGSYMTHDMLHMRGGHQVSWLLDGVEIPNTNIASNLGPQIDPRDIAYLQVDRGSYNADLGDRTYGMFNVNPKSGFERDREGELMLTAGSALTTDDQLSLGDHSERAAYYVSLSGNRTDYGLEAPIEHAYHDAANGFGAFSSLLFNKDANDQFRLLTQWRKDFFQIPYDPDPSSYENQLYPSSGLRDGQHETDGVAAFTWTHSFGPKTSMAVSPFYHYNSANYEPGANDSPAGTRVDRASNYAGLQMSVSGDVAKNHIEGGVYSWGQHDSELVAVNFADQSYNNFSEQDHATGGLFEEYVSDNYKPVQHVTLIAGIRGSWFSGNGFTETVASPRFGVALEVPRLGWVFRAFYGRFYQPPPLVTVSSPLLQYASENATSFAPLHGERDEEHQFGVTIPLKGWTLDADTFETRASNFLDHSNIGESSVYIPVSVQGALIQAWEVALRSPELWNHASLHLAYSNQIAKQRGPITGGPGCYPLSSPECSGDAWTYDPVDHDQRNTLHVGGDVRLPWAMNASTDVYYGSGFVNGYTDAPSPYASDYLPGHTSFDLRVSKRFSERLSVAVNSTNVTNRRVLLDNSLTFGGFHENDPRQIYGEVRWRFHY